MNRIQVKRIYEKVEPSDGMRILVDRLWPRGVTKEKAAIHEWMKDLAPSHELRKWFHHDEENFAEFERRYRDELAQNDTIKEQFQQIWRWAETLTVTLLYSAKDDHRNQAVVLRDVLVESRKRESI